MKAQRCRSRVGLKVGTCGGELYQMTLVSGAGTMRRRLWCMKCGRPGSDHS